MGAPIRNLSRAEAISQGKKRYFDGSACPQGHLSERLVSNYTCIQCLHEKRWAKNKAKRASEKERRLKPIRKASGLPATKQEAKKEKSRFYFTGKPCPKGHLTKRYTTGGGCQACILEKMSKRNIHSERVRKKLSARKHRDKFRHKTRARYNSDIQFKLRSNIRSRIKHALAGHVKNSSALVYLGCSIEELKAYLEAKFQPGMSWENHNLHGWHIDHIIPLANFDMTKEAHRHRAFHYSNLQPLWASDNLQKNSKLFV